MPSPIIARHREQSGLAGRYHLLERVAVGGMAEIYRARQEALAGFDKDVAIKRLRPELASDPRVVDMFMDEARIGALLVHPHTVQVYDAGEHDGVPFIAMEYIEGEELVDLCRRGLAAGRFLPLEHAVELIRQAALSLGHFHAARDHRGRELEIVHCDISPTNLLVTGEGFLKVIDFGIARFLDQRCRDQASVPGKLSYMSPEQARGEPLDGRSDIFSLGVVLYEITVGRRLFKGPAREVIDRLSRAEIEPPTFVRRDYPGALESAVMRALEASPTNRYGSAYDLADDLAAFLGEINQSPKAHHSGGPLVGEIDRRTGPLAVARYLDELAVAGGAERRRELIGEAEDLEDEDALDFDRGDWVAQAAPGGGAALADWDEYEEDEQAVADALGIDVSLVRAPARKEAPGGTRAPARSRAPAPTPPPAPTPATPAPAAAPAARPTLAPLVALLLGAIAGGLIVYLALHFFA
jgi:serine/threonine-protein kinase